MKLLLCILECSNKEYQTRHTVTSRVTWKKLSLISNQTHSHITRDLEDDDVIPDNVSAVWWKENHC